MIIAIDGFSSCGKSTLARDLASRLGFVYVDTGAMYRAVTLFAIRNQFFAQGHLDEEKIREAMGSLRINFQYNAEKKANEIFLNGENVEEDIRGMAVSEKKVSEVSTKGFIREILVSLQQEMGARGSLVMDGRDIGTVVFPRAGLKIFVTASAEIRAIRRYNELKNKGVEVSLDEIRENLNQRDTMDQNRKESPLRQAEDALVLDNSRLDRQQQLEWALAEVERIRNS